MEPITNDQVNQMNNKTPLFLSAKDYIKKIAHFMKLCNSKVAFENEHLMNNCKSQHKIKYLNTFDNENDFYREIYDDLNITYRDNPHSRILDSEIFITLLCHILDCIEKDELLYKQPEIKMYCTFFSEFFIKNESIKDIVKSFALELYLNWDKRIESIYMILGYQKIIECIKTMLSDKLMKEKDENKFEQKISLFEAKPLIVENSIESYYTLFTYLDQHFSDYIKFCELSSLETDYKFHFFYFLLSENILETITNKDDRRILGFFLFNYDIIRKEQQQKMMLHKIISSPSNAQYLCQIIQTKVFKDYYHSSKSEIITDSNNIQTNNLDLFLLTHKQTLNTLKPEQLVLYIQKFIIPLYFSMNLKGYTTSFYHRIGINYSFIKENNKFIEESICNQLPGIFIITEKTLEKHQELRLFAYVIIVLIHEFNHWLRRYHHQNKMKVSTPRENEFMELDGGELFIISIFRRRYIDSLNDENIKMLLTIENWENKEAFSAFSNTYKPSSISWMKNETRRKCTNYVE